MNGLPLQMKLQNRWKFPNIKLMPHLKSQPNMVSMDAPLTQDEDLKFLDVFVTEDTAPTDSELLKESLGKEIQRSLATLSEKERDVINLYYGIGTNHEYTLEEIGAKFDLTRERVRQIKEKAIRRLKHNSRSRLLKVYLGE